jgi:hypothetical protein
MSKFLVFCLSFLLIGTVVYAQEASAVHEIKKGVEPNEYIIKTTITGLKGVDIARATYKVDDLHSYEKVAGNELFSSRNKEYIKFYVMGVPDSGTITVELGLILSDNGSYSFPVEFQYSRNDKKKIVQFPELIFEGEELLASEEIVSEIPVAVKQEPENVVIVETDSVPSMETSSLASPVTTVNSVVEVEKEETIEEELADTKVKYTIQLLSLSKFSQERFDEYCDKHSLLSEEVSTRVVNGMTKVIYGNVSSLDEAKKLIERLKLLNNIDGAFAVPL